MVGKAVMVALVNGDSWWEVLGKEGLGWGWRGGYKGMAGLRRYSDIEQNLIYSRR
jgi:hypothetical protein